MESPFLLFPKEVWEIILDRVDDAKDVIRICKMSPILDISFQERKHYWLIGQILAFLAYFGSISEEDVLNCRLVCKQWLLRVDHFLENQQILRAYHLDYHKDEKDFWDPIDQVVNNLDKENNEDYQGEGCNQWVNTFIGGFTFQTGFTNFSKFHRNVLELCPPRKNPFVARAVSIIILNEEGLESFWNNMISIFERYGCSIWYLNVSMSGNQSGKLEFWRKLFEILHILPCLKMLRLESIGNVACSSFKAKQFIKMSLSVLPQLETIKLMSNSFPHCITRQILMKYGIQVRRMELPMDLWDEDYNRIFQNLTELDVNDEMQSEELSSQKLETLPDSLIAPNLVKLQLGFSTSTVELGVKKDIFKWLKRFPSLKYFNMGDDCGRVHPNVCGYELKESEIPNPNSDLIPSLVNISIRDNLSLSYNFLLCFPNLRHLQICAKSEPSVTDLSMPESYMNFREPLQTGNIYESNVWKLLPKLKKVTVYIVRCYDGVLEEELNFERDTYEKFQKINENRKNVSKGFSPLRPDILADLAYYDSLSSGSYLDLSE